MILKIGGRIRQAYTRQPLWRCSQKKQPECKLQPLGASPNGWCHDASNSTRSVLCLKHSGCTTSCTNGSNGQPATGFHVAAAAAADDDDGSTTTTGFKSIRSSLWSHCPPVWLRYARSSVQSIYRPYLDHLSRETHSLSGNMGRLVGSINIESAKYED